MCRCEKLKSGSIGHLRFDGFSMGGGGRDGAPGSTCRTLGYLGREVK